MSVAGEDTRPPALKKQLTAKAIMFDFVNPLLAFGRSIDRGSKLGINTTEFVFSVEHERTH
jgi:hypothetical protein